MKREPDCTDSTDDCIANAEYLLKRVKERHERCKPMAQQDRVEAYLHALALSNVAIARMMYEARDVE